MQHYRFSNKNTHSRAALGKAQWEQNIVLYPLHDFNKHQIMPSVFNELSYSIRKKYLSDIRLGVQQRRKTPDGVILLEWWENMRKSFPVACQAVRWCHVGQTLYHKRTQKILKQCLPKFWLSLVQIRTKISMKTTRWSTIQFCSIAQIWCYLNKDCHQVFFNLEQKAAKNKFWRLRFLLLMFDGSVAWLG